MTIRTLTKWTFGLWTAGVVAGIIHHSLVEPVLQMPVAGWNRIVIAIGWFLGTMVIAGILAGLALALPRGQPLRKAAFLPIALHVVLLVLVAATVAFQP